MTLAETEASERIARRGSFLAVTSTLCELNR